MPPRQHRDWRRPTGPFALDLSHPLAVRLLGDLYVPFHLRSGLSVVRRGGGAGVLSVSGNRPSPGPAPDPLGWAMQSVSGGAFTVPTNATDTYQTNFAIAFWVRCRSTGQANKYLLERDRNGLSIIYGYVANAVEVFSSFYTGSDPRTGSQITVSDTQWHHIAYTYDGATWSGYLDGRVVFSTARTFSMPSTASSTAVLGNNWDLTANPDIDLAEVLMVPYALSAAEVAYLWAPSTRWDLHGQRRRTYFVPAGAGGTTYTQTLTGALTLAGVIRQQPAVRLVGAATPAGALRQLAATGHAGTLTSAGAAREQGQPRLTGTLTPSGVAAKRANTLTSGALTSSGTVALLKVALRSFAGGLTTAGALAQRPALFLSASLAGAGTLARHTHQALSGAVTAVGQLRQAISQRVIGALTSSGALLAVRAALLTLAGAVASTGAVRHTVLPRLGGALLGAGVLLRHTSKALSGTAASSGRPLVLVQRPLAGVVGWIGALLTSIGAAIQPPVLRLPARNGQRVTLIAASAAFRRLPARKG